MVDIFKIKCYVLFVIKLKLILDLIWKWGQHFLIPHVKLGEIHIPVASYLNFTGFLLIQPAQYARKQLPDGERQPRAQLEILFISTQFHLRIKKCTQKRHRKHTRTKIWFLCLEVKCWPQLK